MSRQDPRFTPKRRATVASLLMAIALIAIGLGRLREKEPWFALRKAHPGMASIPDLFTRDPKSFRCETCHAMPKAPFQQIAQASLSHVTARNTDCKSCHGR